MKKILVSLVALFLFIASHAQTKPVWPEMKDFHGVMSTTFHPAEENNLKPVRDKAGELVSKAVAWQKSEVPAGFNATVSKPILKKLVKQAKLIKKQVGKNASDEVLKKEITTAHDIFHELAEKCRTEDHEH